MKRRVHGWAIKRGTVTEAQAGLLADVRLALSRQDAQVLREGHTRLTAAPPRLCSVWKWRRRVGWRARLKGLLGPTEACVEFDSTRRAEQFDLPVARPLFVAERRALGLLQETVIAFERIPDSCGLDRLLAGWPEEKPFSLAATERREALRGYGALLASVHRAGLAHRDAHADNVLVQRDDGGLKLRLLDWLHSTAAPADDDPRKGADLRGAVEDLAWAGVALPEVLAFYRAYCHEMSWPVSEQRRTARALVRHVRRRAEHLIGRAEFLAFRETRRHVRADAGRHFIMCLRGLPMERVAATFSGHSESAWPWGTEAVPLEDVEVVDDREARQTWQAACVCERFRLPYRRVVAFLAALGRNEGSLLMRAAGGSPIEPELAARQTRQGTLRDLKALARVLHFYGLRLRSCSAGHVFRADPAGVPGGFRTGGLIVMDPRVLRLAPRESTAGSWEVLAGHVRSVCGAAAGDAFAPPERGTVR